MIKYAEIII